MISKRRIKPDRIPHIFFINGAWHVIFRKAHWGSPEFAKWLDAKNWAYEMNQLSHYAKLLRNRKCSKPS